MKTTEQVVQRLRALIAVKTKEKEETNDSIDKFGLCSQIIELLALLEYIEGE